MKTHEQFQGGELPVLLREAWPAVEPAHPFRGIAGEGAQPRAVAEYENRFHAVRSGLAGVSGALHVLLGDHGAVDPRARDDLESVLIAEVERLQRLVAPIAPSAAENALKTTEELDLDEIVREVVLSRRMAGQEVAWSPTGLRARGRRDDVAEVLHILLVNAWRHARGAPSRIVVALEDAQVVVRVSDDGPGVLPELRQAIFERGVRRPGSPGQGLGLAMARELVEGVGGSLTLSPATRGGACFCVVLPTVEKGPAA
jgi:signal transduction histidine kinase